MGEKFQPLSCICIESWEVSSPKPPRGSLSPKHNNFNIEGPKVKAVFEVIGMTCSACSASIEKAIKRLPGIIEAAIDVLNNKAHVLYYPSFLTVSILYIL